MRHATDNPSTQREPDGGDETWKRLRSSVGDASGFSAFTAMSSSFSASLPPSSIFAS
jgi:hypothetical protein